MVCHGNESKNVDAKPRNTAIAPNVFTGPKHPIFTAAPHQRRFLPNWAGSAGMLIVLISGAIGLYRFSIDVTEHAQLADPANLPDAGFIVHSQFLHIWLSDAMAELAKRQCQSKVVRTHEELQQYLKHQDKGKLWYALIFRLHRADGGLEELARIRMPCDDAIHFDELLDVLATAAGNPPQDTDQDYKRATVQIISPALSKSEPREAIAELLDDPPEQADREGSP